MTQTVYISLYDRPENPHTHTSIASNFGYIFIRKNKFVCAERRKNCETILQNRSPSSLSFPCFVSFQILTHEWRTMARNKIKTNLNQYARLRILKFMWHINFQSTYSFVLQFICIAAVCVRGFGGCFAFLLCQDSFCPVFSLLLCIFCFVSPKFYRYLSLSVVRAKSITVFFFYLKKKSFCVRYAVA